MSPEWKTQILTLDKESEDEALTFVNLVDQAVGNCDFETTRILLKTFTTDDDYGIQESVVSALSTAKVEEYQSALIDELPRLFRDAPEWAQVLIEREAKNSPGPFFQIVMNSSVEIQQLVSQLLKDCS